MYINSVAENTNKNARMIKEVRSGEAHEFLMNQESFTIPRITSDKNEVKVAGTAVFHGYNNQMVGFLGEEEGAKRKIQANTRDKEHIQFEITIECSFYGAVLSALIPFSLYKLNEKLHEIGDPPWKKDS